MVWIDASGLHLQRTRRTVPKMLETRPTAPHLGGQSRSSPPSPAQVRFLPQLEKLTLTLLTTSLLLLVLSISPNTYEPHHQTLFVISRTVKCLIDSMGCPRRKLIHIMITYDKKS